MATDRSARRGPAPLDPSEKRDHCVSVRLSAAELADLDAKRGRHQRGEWMRIAALDVLPPAPAPEINRQAWSELGRMASNINQIARQLNAGEHSELADVLTVISELRAELLSLRAPRARRVSES